MQDTVTQAPEPKSLKSQSLEELYQNLKIDDNFS